MPSLAARILKLHAQKKTRDEIQRTTQCTSEYLRSVLSRAASPDEATRQRRTHSCARGTLKYAAKLHGWSTYREIIRMGGSKTTARAAQRERQRTYLRTHQRKAASKQVSSAPAGAVQRV